MMTKKLTIVYASDWGCYSEQIAATHDFELVKGWVAGFVIRETDEMLVLAHQVFDGGDVRHVTTIPKCNVLERREIDTEASA